MNFILFSERILCFAFEEWKDFRKIFTTCTILAAMRDDKDASAMKGQIRYLTEAYGAHIELLRAPLVEISSTTIRERAQRDSACSYMVPDVVAGYYKEKNLYI